MASRLEWSLSLTQPSRGIQGLRCPGRGQPLTFPLAAISAHRRPAPPQVMGLHLRAVAVGALRSSKWNVGLLLRCSSRHGPHLGMTAEPLGFSRPAWPGEGRTEHGDTAPGPTGYAAGALCGARLLRELVMDREAWHAVIHGVAKSWRSHSKMRPMPAGAPQERSNVPF